MPALSARLVCWARDASATKGGYPMATVLCVLYDDPVDGYPTSYARDEIPRIERYYDGQTAPTPAQVDFTPGVLLGSVSGELGLRRFLEGRGHRLVVTSDKDGPDSVFERELPDDLHVRPVAPHPPEGKALEEEGSDAEQIAPTIERVAHRLFG